MLVRVHGRGAETHVDDAYLVGRAVGEHPVKGAEQAGDGARALRVQDAQVQDVGVGGDAYVLRVRDAPVAGGERGDVRAVPVRVVRAPLAREVLTVDDAQAVAAV